jgi:inorganic pyrophosphatase
MNDKTEAEFWSNLETIINQDSIIIDRPKGTTHPTFPELIYPLDYGYLENMVSSDGAGLDVWIDDCSDKKPTALACTVDLRKKDLEIKILLGCSTENIETIMEFHNSGSMRCILLQRPNKEVLDKLVNNS